MCSVIFTVFLRSVLLSDILTKTMNIGKSTGIFLGLNFLLGNRSLGILLLCYGLNVSTKKCISGMREEYWLNVVRRLLVLFPTAQTPEIITQKPYYLNHCF